MAKVLILNICTQTFFLIENPIFEQNLQKCTSIENDCLPLFTGTL